MTKQRLVLAATFIGIGAVAFEIGSSLGRLSASNQVDYWQKRYDEVQQSKDRLIKELGDSIGANVKTEAERNGFRSKANENWYQAARSEQQRIIAENDLDAAKKRIDFITPKLTEAVGNFLDEVHKVDHRVWGVPLKGEFIAGPIDSRPELGLREAADHFTTAVPGIVRALEEERQKERKPTQ